MTSGSLTRLWGAPAQQELQALGAGCAVIAQSCPAHLFYFTN